MFVNEHYQLRANRDARAKELAAQYGKGRVSRRSTKGACLHPQYVRDYPHEVCTGFGNAQYKTFFSTLYTVEVR